MPGHVSALLPLLALAGAGAAGAGAGAGAAHRPGRQPQASRAAITEKHVQRKLEHVAEQVKALTERTEALERRIATKPQHENAMLLTMNSSVDAEHSIDGGYRPHKVEAEASPRELKEQFRALIAEKEVIQARKKQLTKQLQEAEDAETRDVGLHPPTETILHDMSALDQQSRQVEAMLQRIEKKSKGSLPFRRSKETEAAMQSVARARPQENKARGAQLKEKRGAPVSLVDGDLPKGRTVSSIKEHWQKRLKQLQQRKEDLKKERMSVALELKESEQDLRSAVEVEDWAAIKRRSRELGGRISDIASEEAAIVARKKAIQKKAAEHEEEERAREKALLEERKLKVGEMRRIKEKEQEAARAKSEVEKEEQRRLLEEAKKGTDEAMQGVREAAQRARIQEMEFADREAAQQAHAKETTKPKKVGSESPPP